MPVCSKCKKRVASDVDFCPHCRASLFLPSEDMEKFGFNKPPCPHCGLHIQQDVEICPYCNKSILNPPKKGAITDPEHRKRKLSLLERLGIFMRKSNKHTLALTLAFALLLVLVIPRFIRPSAEPITLEGYYVNFEQYPEISNFFGKTRRYNPPLAQIDNIVCQTAGDYLAVSADLTATTAITAIQWTAGNVTPLYAHAFVISSNGDIKWSEKAPVITRDGNLKPDEICTITLSNSWEIDAPPLPDDKLLMYIFFNGAIVFENNPETIQSTVIAMSDGLINDFQSGK